MNKTIDRHATEKAICDEFYRRNGENELAEKSTEVAVMSDEELVHCAWFYRVEVVYATDIVQIPASELRTGDFIACCEDWPNGREVLRVYHDCNGVDIMFRTCGDKRYHWDQGIHPQDGVTISKTFSQRFAN